MPVNFKIDSSIASFVDKSTLLKVLTCLDESEIETPCLIIDGDKVRRNASVIGSNIKECKVFYAVKANPDLEILRILNNEGIGFEIASGGELQLLSELGVEPDRIISSNPVKTFNFLRYAGQYGVNRFSFDSYDEIDKIAEFIPGAKVYVRLAVPNDGSEWPLTNKFGVELDDALALLLTAQKKGLVSEGVTFHVGSQCTNLYNWNIALDKAKLLWSMSETAGIKLNLLNLGGGYPIKYTKSVLSIQKIERHINVLLKDRFPDTKHIHLEPGRAMIGDAGIIVSRVTGKAKRGDENWLYIDIGVFNGLMESVGGIRYSYIFEARNIEGKKRGWTLAGPSCDSFDVIDKNLISVEPRVGDLVLILSGGAYTTSYASKFNGFSLPKTIVI